ncbi:MAG: YraN family protein [Pseudomonadota bacterium]|uniref:YraN family protein n=1 Tax=Fodinicurvata fenggangensis TaxID=1121830 RepID=UPI00054F9B75|nr:YraN family protein [Fodinicurvata fenggangensis]
MSRSARLSAWKRGRRAETLASFWLRMKGYRVLAQGLRTPVGEIDLVVSRGAILAFVEVKHRATHEQALLAITERQRHRIERAASYYLSRRPELAERQLRFDGLLLVPGRLPRHLPDLWRP